MKRFKNILVAVDSESPKQVALNRAIELASHGRARVKLIDVVRELGGSFSAEHGIGLLKVRELAGFKSPVEMALMRTVKNALDPKGLMNPGKVL